MFLSTQWFCYCIAYCGGLSLLLLVCCCCNISPLSPSPLPPFPLTSCGGVEEVVIAVYLYW